MYNKDVKVTRGRKREMTSVEAWSGVGTYDPGPKMRLRRAHGPRPPQDSVKVGAAQVGCRLISEGFECQLKALNFYAVGNKKYLM